MSTGRTVLVSLIMTLLVWGFFTWPLPRHLTSGIPSSSANIEKDHVRRMIMGDHLQLLYHFWLSSDMLTGRTPPFYNLYEFNTGNDAERKYVGFDNAPFSVVFTAGHLLGGRALGWNLMGFTAVWLTCLFSCLLLAGYTSNRFLPPLLAALVIAVPYRWTALLGGSPSGLAITWVPMLLWGMDAMIRRASFTGGCVAALAILFCYWNDTYVFFFCMLLGPCWAILVMLRHETMAWRSLRHWRKMIVAALPLLLLVAVVVILGQLKQAHITTVESGTGHDNLREVTIASPAPQGLIAWRGFGTDGIVYLGYVMPAALLAGWLVLAWQLIRRPRAHWREWVLLTLLLTGLTGMVLLALGTRGPANGKVFMLARELVPPYGLIRQPAKIFSLLPPLLALAALLGLGAIARALGGGRVATIAVGLVVLAAVGEYGLQIRPTICLLDKQQPAYAAVAEDAAAHGKAPRALILPLWPGNSAWASLYEHYVSLYRIRMLNGYQPVVPLEHIDKVFQTFDSCTSGAISDEQISRLRKMGVDYLVLHEDAFPEQVSSFPVAFTIKRLLNHPRLDLLRQHENVWAFKLCDDAAARPPLQEQWNTFFPVGHAIRELEWHAPAPDLVRNDVSASGDQYLVLAPDRDDPVRVPFYHSSTPDTRMLMRLRGTGRLELATQLDADTHLQSLTNDNAAWTWQDIPLTHVADDCEGVLLLKCTAGAIDADLLLYTAGRPLFVQPGQSVELPAPLFFHAGYTDLAADAVVLRADQEPDDELFYGPNLPLASGRYELTMSFSSAAPAGTALGEFSLTCGDVTQGPFPVAAGRPAAYPVFIPEKNLPARFAFRYMRHADMQIERVVFTRIR